MDHRETFTPAEVAALRPLVQHAPVAVEIVRRLNPDPEKAGAQLDALLKISELSPTLSEITRAHLAHRYIAMRTVAIATAATKVAVFVGLLIAGAEWLKGWLARP